MSSAKASSPAVDEARRKMCRTFAESMNGEGTTHVRIRIHQADGKPTEAWFYAHKANVWNKASGAVTEKKLVAALAEVAEMLASGGHEDEWSSRRHGSADFVDTDLLFQSDAVAKHRGPKLESWLYGLLFKDAHASGKHRGRKILRGPRRARP